jgi:hypothetical protein
VAQLNAQRLLGQGERMMGVSAKLAVPGRVFDGVGAQDQVRTRTLMVGLHDRGRGES